MRPHLAYRYPPASLAGVIVALLLASVAGAGAGEPILEGYADHGDYCVRLKSIAASRFATLESLGTTLGDRDVFLLRIGVGKTERKPAILIVGSVEPPHLLGSELAVRLARRLVERAETDKSVAKLLRRVTFYVIPRPAPDACEAFFRRPYVERSVNERPTDDDHDGRTDEDGPDDLNGDGVITMMRVEDPAGQYMAHPDDPRVLIKADPKRNEQGCWSLLVEGRDNDGDDVQNEDPPGGVAFNRNFTFAYPYFDFGAGPHQVSEVETRAVADFAFSHPNIAVVLTFTPEDNLSRPWKPNASAESKRVKTTLLSADAGYFNYLAEQYREIHKGKGAPDSPQGKGSFSRWAYFHYGRWSLACRGWWIPKVDAGKADKPEEPSDKKPSDEKRGAADRNALRWFAREKIDGFVDWKRIEHPDFPGKRVEVGGFKPLLRMNPPAEQLEPLTDKHWRFLRRLTELLPRVRIEETKAEMLGGGVWRVTAVVVNHGYLPSVSKMGQITRQPHPLQIQIELPKGASLVTGHTRSQLSTLAGRGGKAEKTWLVRMPPEGETSLRVRVWSPSVGEHAKSVQLIETIASKKDGP